MISDFVLLVAVILSFSRKPAIILCPWRKLGREKKFLITVNDSKNTKN